MGNGCLLELVEVCDKSVEGIGGFVEREDESYVDVLFDVYTSLTSCKTISALLISLSTG